MLIIFLYRSLYLQAECDSITSLWIQLISSEMGCQGYELEDQKLTVDDVPVIVDK